MIIFSMGCLGVVVIGCAGTFPVTQPSPSPRPKPPVQMEKPVVTPSKKPSPRTTASLQLTEQGRSLLKSGKPDDAISTLERAVNLNPSNGQNYYYLSEAWLMKGNVSQAREFNRLAGIYLEGYAKWIGRVAEQSKRINKK